MFNFILDRANLVPKYLRRVPEEIMKDLISTQLKECFYKLGLLKDADSVGLIAEVTTAW
jgi:hypothetical protein